MVKMVDRAAPDPDASLYARRRSHASGVKRNPKLTKAVLNEIALLHKAGNHRHLVGFKGWYEDAQGTTPCGLVHYGYTYIHI